MTNPEKIKQILLSEIEKMNQHREDFCKRPGIDFTRDRKIPFDTLLHFQISMESGSVNHELLKYFRFDAAAPSLSAFYQQRAKLSDAVVQPIRKRNEFAALYQLIDRHTPCGGTVPVFIADRGFHAYNVFARAIENRAFFVIFAFQIKLVFFVIYFFKMVWNICALYEIHY